MEFIRPKKSALSLDIAPLIDVVFQLLVFFMLSSSFLSPVMKLNLPKAMTQDTRQVERVVVSIDVAGDVFVNAEKVTMSGLEGSIRSALMESKKKSVDLRGDEEMPYKTFVEVMDLARQAGASQVNIVHQVEREE